MTSHLGITNRRHHNNSVKNEEPKIADNLHEDKARREILMSLQIETSPTTWAAITLTLVPTSIVVTWAQPARGSGRYAFSHVIVESDVTNLQGGDKKGIT